MAFTQVSTDGIKNGTITGSDLATNIKLTGQADLHSDSGSALTEPLMIRNGGSGAGTNVGMVFFNGDGTSTGAGALAKIKAIDVGSFDADLVFETALKSGFSTGGTTERLRITSTGDLRINDGAQVFGAANDGNSSCLTMDYASSTGRIMGHGSSGGKLAFFTNASGSGVSQQMTIASDGKVGIGATDPVSNLHISNSFGTPTGGIDSNITLLLSHTSAGNSVGYGMLSATNGVCFMHFGDTANADQGSIVYNNVNDSMSFTVNTQQQLLITSAGDVLIRTGSTTINQSNAGSGFLSDGVFKHFRAVGGGQHVCNIGGNNGLMQVRGDGDVVNTNNEYGAISDVNLKQDIIDAASQWNDIKALKVRKFRFKNNPTGILQIGVVAQEVEKVSAGLVKTDDEGVKSVKYSVLYMKAVKCLQEAMAKIEILETEVAALKGS